MVVGLAGRRTCTVGWGAGSTRSGWVAAAAAAGGWVQLASSRALLRALLLPVRGCLGLLEAGNRQVGEADRNPSLSLGDCLDGHDPRGLRPLPPACGRGAVGARAALPQALPFHQTGAALAVQNRDLRGALLVRHACSSRRVRKPESRPGSPSRPPRLAGRLGVVQPPCAVLQLAYTRWFRGLEADQTQSHTQIMNERCARGCKRQQAEAVARSLAGALQMAGRCSVWLAYSVDGSSAKLFG